MSIMEQAGAASRERAVPEQVVHLTDATAVMEDSHWGPETFRRVLVTGIDGEGAVKKAAIPFAQHFRGEAAVLVDEIARTGDVALRGRVQLGTKSFEAESAQSGTASLDQSHARFDLKRVLSHGIGAIKGRTQDDVEDLAVAAHRQKAAVGR